MLPRNAQRIVSMRLAGSRPSDPVVVSFTERSPFDSPTIFATPGVEYDWRFLLDLETFIIVTPGASDGQAIRAIFEMARLYPTLIDSERRAMASIVSARPFKAWPFARSSEGWRSVFA